MPKQQLLSCGLLTEHPLKSSVFQKLLQGKSHVKFTKREKMHIVALYWTPELPKSWIEEQFRRFGAPHPTHILKRLRRVAYDPRWRAKWEHLGPKNVDFIGQKEVEIFYTRRDLSKRIYHPFWALPVLLDERKNKMSDRAVGEKYLLHPGTVKALRKRNMFAPVFKPWEGNQQWRKYRLTGRS